MMDWLIWCCMLSMDYFVYNGESTALKKWCYYVYGRCSFSLIGLKMACKFFCFLNSKIICMAGDWRKTLVPIKWYAYDPTLPWLYTRIFMMMILIQTLLWASVFVLVWRECVSWYAIPCENTRITFPIKRRVNTELLYFV